VKSKKQIVTRSSGRKTFSKPTFTIDDGVAFNPNTKPRSVLKAIQMLEELPFKALLTVRGLASRIELSVDRTAEIVMHLNDYRTRDGLRFLYGNPKTIKALNEQEG
jgi:hypothetical protein